MALPDRISSVDWLWRASVAQCSILLFLCLDMTHLSLPHEAEIQPFFFLMALYYWAIFRPSLLPVPYLFFLGLLFDLQKDFPLGLSAIIFITIRSVIQRNRLFLMGQPFVVVWVGFAALTAVYSFSVWFFACLDYASLLPYGASLTTGVSSVLLFPLFSLLLLAVHRILPVPSGGVYSAG